VTKIKYNYQTVEHKRPYQFRRDNLVKFATATGLKRKVYCTRFKSVFGYYSIKNWHVPVCLDLD